MDDVIPSHALIVRNDPDQPYLVLQSPDGGAITLDQTADGTLLIRKMCAGQPGHRSIVGAVAPGQWAAAVVMTGYAARTIHVPSREEPPAA